MAQMSSMFGGFLMSAKLDGVVSNDNVSSVSGNGNAVDLFRAVRRTNTQTEVKEEEHNLESSMLWGLIMRMVSVRSEEAARSAGAAAAIKLEFNNAVELQAFKPEAVYEWADVCERAPDLNLVHLMYSHVILGIKGAELEVENQKWKARLVGDGNRIYNGYGQIVFPRHEHMAPASLCMIRILMFFSLTQDDGVTLLGDAKNAYLKSVLPGPAQTWLCLDKILRPQSHGKFKIPVVSCDRALYGHPVAGAAWGLKVKGDLLADSWCKIADIGQFSIYSRKVWDNDRYRTALLVVYTDDFGLGGTRRITLPLFARLHLQFGFDEKSLADPELRALVGLSVHRPVDCGNRRMCFISQEQYILMICEKYCEEEGIALSSLKPISTPCKSKPDRGDEHKALIAGKLRGESSKHIGRLLWVMRGCRLDTGVGVSRLSRRQTVWSILEDEALHRMYRYLYATLGIGLWFIVDADDVAKLTTECFVDSDHAGDRTVTARSTTGYAITMTGMQSWATINWSVKMQGSTARSSGEAESSALSDATFTGATPVMSLWDQIACYVVPMCMNIDNDAARQSTMTGESKQMSGVLRKHHDVSLDALHEFYCKDGRSLRRIDSAANPADILTKPLDHILHWRFMQLLRMGTRSGPLSGTSSVPNKAIEN
jgi:hypothetical protein